MSTWLEHYRKPLPAIEDAPNFVVGALKKGECIRARVFVHYALRDDEISRVSLPGAVEMSRSQPA